MTERRKADVSLRQIEVFVRVFSERSFSKAARLLGLSQPTVSTHLRTLESGLGVELFHRRGRTIRPTGAAETLYTHAIRLLRQRDATVASVAGVDGELRGELLLGASNIPGAYLLPRQVARFADRHPNSSVPLVIDGSRDVLERVRKGSVDLGFVGSEPEDHVFSRWPYGSDRLLLVAAVGSSAAGHPLAGRIVQPERLKRQRFVTREQGSGSRRAAEAALSALGLEFGEDLKVVLEVSSNEAVREAVRAGVGLAFLSELSVRDAVERQELGEVRVNGLSVLRQFYAVGLRERPLSPIASAFLEGGRDVVIAPEAQ